MKTPAPSPLLSILPAFRGAAAPAARSVVSEARKPGISCRQLCRGIDGSGRSCDLPVCRGMLNRSTVDALVGDVRPPMR